MLTIWMWLEHCLQYPNNNDNKQKKQDGQTYIKFTYKPESMNEKKSFY